MKIPNYDLREFYITTLAKRFLSIYVHEIHIESMEELSTAYPDFAKYVHDRMHPIVDAMKKDQSPNGYHVPNEKINQYHSWHSWDYII